MNELQLPAPRNAPIEMLAPGQKRVPTYKDYEQMTPAQENVIRSLMRRGPESEETVQNFLDAWLK